MNAPADTSEPQVDLEALEPFNDERVNGLFFPGGGRQDLLDQVIHLLRYGPPLLYLYGDQGVGKHFFIDHLIEQLDEDLFDVAMVNGETMNIAHGVLHACTRAWHSRQPLELSNFREKVVAVANDADMESKILVCIMRHSQFLDQQTVDMVAELLASCAGLPVKFLLVADVKEPDQAPLLKNLLDRVPENYLLEMEPLGQRATSEYLQYRLRTAGMGQVFFNESQLEQIYNRSMGNIDLINQVAASQLQDCLPKPAPKAVPPVAKEAEKFQLPHMHLAALGVVALLLLVVFFAGSGDESESEVAGPVPEISLDAESGAGNGAEQPEDSPFMPVAQQQAIPEADVSEKREPSKATSTSAPEPELVLQKVQDEEPVFLDQVQQQPAAEAAEPADTLKATAPKITPVAEPAPKPAPKPVVEPKPPAVAEGRERTDWLKSLPPENYTVQLLGAKELSTVRRFMGMYPSLQGVVFYKTTRQGQPWYVIVQGNYPSHEAAKAATTQYPSQLRKQGPWIRKLEAIQKEL